MTYQASEASPLQAFTMSNMLARNTAILYPASLFSYSEAGVLLWGFDSGDAINDLSITTNYIICGGVRNSSWTGSTGYASSWKINLSGVAAWGWDAGADVSAVGADGNYIAIGNAGSTAWQGSSSVSANLWVLDTDGNLQWYYDTSGTIVKIKVLDGKVWAGDDNTLYKFGTTGDLLWSLSLASTTPTLYMKYDINNNGYAYLIYNYYGASTEYIVCKQYGTTGNLVRQDEILTYSTVTHETLMDNIKATTNQLLLPISKISGITPHRGVRKYSASDGSKPQSKWIYSRSIDSQYASNVVTGDDDAVYFMFNLVGISEDAIYKLDNPNSSTVTLQDSFHTRGIRAADMSIYGVIFGGQYAAGSSVTE